MQKVFLKVLFKSGKTKTYINFTFYCTNFDKKVIIILNGTFRIIALLALDTCQFPMFADTNTG